MDPVSLSVSILLPAVGWLVEATISKNIEEAWQNYVKSVDLHKDNDNLKAELDKIRLLVEAADYATLRGKKATLLEGYLKKVKELVYEARNLIDELDYFRLQEEVKKMNKSKHGNALTIFNSLSPSDIPSSSTAGSCNKFKLHKRSMSNRFKDLTHKLKQAYESLNPALTNQLLSLIANGMQKGTNQMATSNRSQTTAEPPRENVYGRDNEKELILKLIKDAEQNSQHLPVITIVGNGGVGKTTLAKLIYNDSTTSFSKRMWICVSTDFNVERIIREMLEYFPQDDRRCAGQNLNNLTEILRDKLKGERVLVVLDDIWEIKTKKMEWKQLLDQFSPKTSTILVTTRDLSIANMVKTIDPIIQLGGLEENSFWSLFKKCALGDDQCMVPPQLEDIGKAIVKRLQGYPLAAKTVGALLNEKTDRLYWEEVLESEKWKFQGDDGDIMPALRLSYEYLQAHLQRCFSYCSLFPRDYEFKAQELVYMWMAQDYICMNGKRLEDVGLDYLKELVDKAFFHEKVDKYCTVYVIHDLLHDLAETVSKEEFLAINHPNPTPNPPRLRHISFLLDTKYTIENHVFQNLSSLVIFGKAKALKDTINWHQENKFHLRLLIMPFMSSISCNFTHLRYLKLYFPGWYNGVCKEKVEFPVQICILYHLQVLEIEDHQWESIKELPKEFNNLVNLRHFIASENLHSMIVGVGRLKHLQELRKFVVREEKGFELGQLSELKELRESLYICSLQNVTNREEAEIVRLSEKEISVLTLSWDKETRDKPQKNIRGEGIWRTLLNAKGRECKTTGASSDEILEALQPNSELRDLYIINYGGCKSPSWLTNHSIKYLEFIHLEDCEAWEELPNFGQLMCLKELQLSHLPRVKALGPEFHGCGLQEGFPSLKMLEVSDMDELETWDWGEGRNIFPSLEELGVSDCPNLRKFTFLDLCPVHEERTKLFPKLNYLTIKNCPKLQQAIPPEIFSFLSTRRIIGASIDGRVGDISYGWDHDVMTIRHLKDPEALTLITPSLKNICSMDFLDCPKLTSLSWKHLCLITNLKSLTFRLCNELCFTTEENDTERMSYTHESLQYLRIDTCGVTGEELSYLLAHLPALRKLTIRACHRIGSVKLPGSIDETNRASSEAEVKVDKHQRRNPNSLMCLEKLEIDDCPNMDFVNEGGLSGLTALKKVIISGFAKLLYSLNQKDGSHYVHTLIIEQSNVTSLQLHSFVALRNLKLYNCKDLASVEGPDSLASLLVRIRYCPKLAETQSQMEPKFVMAVEDLSIDNMEFLSIHANSFSMSLHSLTIRDHDWNEWTEEQEDVVTKHLTALEELTLGCRNLRSLPNTLHLHPSLKKLTILFCPKIKSLPPKGFPKSLQKLHLRNCSGELESQCSQLEDFECSNETGELGFTYHVFLKRDP